MKWSRWRLLAGALIGSYALADNRVELHIPEAPPLTFAQYHNGHGIAGDMALRAIIEAGLVATLVTSAWSRAQLNVAQGKDLLITPLSRTPEREQQYTWIAPVMLLERAFFSLSPPVDSFTEARKRYSRVAVGLGTPQEQTLLQAGFKPEQIATVKLGESPVDMLKRGRVDAWFTGLPEAHYLWSDKASTLHQSPVMNASTIYLACSKDCSPDMVVRLQQAMQQLHEKGELKRIKQTYHSRH